MNHYNIKSFRDESATNWTHGYGVKSKNAIYCAIMPPPKGFDQIYLIVRFHPGGGPGESCCRVVWGTTLKPKINENQKTPRFATGPGQSLKKDYSYMILVCRLLNSFTKFKDIL
jgi:hypothetical protein